MMKLKDFINAVNPVAPKKKVSKKKKEDDIE